MEAHNMLLEERRQWETKEEMLREYMDQQWHSIQNAEQYDQQLQSYYQQRCQHQQQLVRLNQILYGVGPASLHHTEGGRKALPPHPVQPMAISPIPAPRNPLQAQEHNNLNMQAATSAAVYMQKKKRAATDHSSDEPSLWSMQNHQKIAKLHHKY
jgi:hypothetical protein